MSTGHRRRVRISKDNIVNLRSCGQYICVLIKKEETRDAQAPLPVQGAHQGSIRDHSLIVTAGW